MLSAVLVPAAVFEILGTKLESAEKLEVTTVFLFDVSILHINKYV